MKKINFFQRMKLTKQYRKINEYNWIFEILRESANRGNNFGEPISGFLEF